LQVERTRDTIDDKAGRVRRKHRGLADSLDESVSTLDRLVRSVRCVNDFDEPHRGRRIEEMQTGDALRIFDRAGEIGNRKRRRIGRQERIRSECVRHGHQGVALEIEALRHGFDGNRRFALLGNRLRPADAIGYLCIARALGVARDTLGAALTCLGVRLDEFHGVPAACRNEGDARTHRATACNQY
jgi:hypothetical protein